MEAGARPESCGALVASLSERRRAAEGARRREAAARQATSEMAQREAEERAVRPDPARLGDLAGIHGYAR